MDGILYKLKEEAGRADCFRHLRTIGLGIAIVDILKAYLDLENNSQATQVLFCASREQVD